MAPLIPPEIDIEDVAYTSGFIGRPEASRMLDRLWKELSWRQETITLYGRRVRQPRLTAWCGDPGAVYRYSGLTLEPLPWHPELLKLRDRLERKLGGAFNSVLANAYRNGGDSMGWHADDERELGARPVIASVSLGEERRFLLRKRGDNRSKGLVLEHGSLLVMKGDCQRNYQHSLPRTARDIGLRINLTYRFVRS